ncbi:MAG: DNA mismatch repair protein MutS [Verrucomicrobiales bacterium]
MATATSTPMMKQYRGMRSQLPAETLLLFRLGDFYEMFFDDAKAASEILNVALTKRNDVPMCGVPYHAADVYVSKLLKAGRRVAICDQVSEPRPGKIVERQITQVLSPGTVYNPALLEDKQGNYLAAVKVGKNGIGLAAIELSTGAFELSEWASADEAFDELQRLSPQELLTPEAQEHAALFAQGPWTPARTDDYVFELDHAEFELREQFGVQNLAGFGLEDAPLATAAAGAALHYIRSDLRRETAHLHRPKCQHSKEWVLLDSATQRHLELVQARDDGPRSSTLLHAIDQTVTGAGGRRLRDWLLHPLAQLNPLQQRQALVAFLFEEPQILVAVREALKEVRDIERIIGRLSQRAGNPRDLAALLLSLLAIPKVLAALQTPARNQWTQDEAGILQGNIDPLPSLGDLLQRALADDPPALARDGGYIRDGYHQGLDELRAASQEGKSWIAALQEREIQRTGVKSLKVRYNSVFGYFIELTKANAQAAPEDYHRKQTTAQGERFITPELKDIESKILGADQRGRVLEEELFAELRQTVLSHSETLRNTAAALAQLDALASLAETARLHSYCRPKLQEGSMLEMVGGRHPVLEQRVEEERFVPNDLHLGEEHGRLIILTGPNMAGKSTFIRQSALLVLLAQIGSYIPADQATIGLVDRIFTRVGASDDLSRGRSTFMVEMTETAHIVNLATEKSFIILDEIGRGTSTFDGIAIAWSVAEHLHDQVGARTLFATHYHELTELAEGRPAVRNFTVAVREWNEQIVFLRKIISGCADKSYGIHVARLAGMPASIVQRAQDLLQRLESGEASGESSIPGDVAGATSEPKPKKRRASPVPSSSEKPQMHLEF